MICSFCSAHANVFFSFFSCVFIIFYCNKTTTILATVNLIINLTTKSLKLVVVVVCVFSPFLPFSHDLITATQRQLQSIKPTAYNTTRLLLIRATNDLTWKNLNASSPVGIYSGKTRAPHIDYLSSIYYLHITNKRNNNKHDFSIRHDRYRR
jgi:hypothetical protein